MHPPALLLLLGTLSYASAAHAAPPKHPPAHATPAPRSNGISHWMGASPHLPLAVTTDGVPTGPTKAEGCAKAASWAAKGRAYKVLDRWGRVQGTTKVVKHERNAVSGCEEAIFAGPEGGEGDALLVSSDSAWRPRATVHPGQETFEDHPAAPVVTSFATFLEGLDARIIHGGVAQDGVSSRVAGAGASRPSRLAYFVSAPRRPTATSPSTLRSRSAPMWSSPVTSPRPAGARST